MSPLEDDPAVWNQVAAVIGRMALRFILWLENALPLMIPATIAAYLFGKHFGYRDAALRLFVVTGVFVSVVGTPAMLSFLGLDIELWKTVICCGLSVFCVKVVKWAEAWIIRRLGLDRRRDNRGGNDAGLE